MALITCENVHMSYDSTDAVNGVSFAVDEGDFLCIIGENGTGKSTLLKGILGLQKLNNGSIKFDALTQKQIGYLPQRTQVQQDFPASVREVVLSGRAKLFNTAADKKIARHNIKLLGIEDIVNKPFNELSGGQQQRVLLARALCSAKKILLLDEPTTGLDPFVTADMYALLSRLNREEKMTIIMVTHDIKNSAQYANKILCMEHDSDYFGTTEEYKKTPMAKQILGGDGNA